MSGRQVFVKVTARMRAVILKLTKPFYYLKSEIECACVAWFLRGFCLAAPDSAQMGSRRQTDCKVELGKRAMLCRVSRADTDNFHFNARIAAPISVPV